MNDPVHPVIRRYAAGEFWAMKAAGLLGGNTFVADVITMLHDAGLPPPLPPEAQQRAELAHAKRILGLDTTAGSVNGTSDAPGRT